MTIDLKPLLDLAGRIIAQEHPEADLLGLIEEYSARFTEWHESAEAGGDLSLLEKSFGAANLKLLSERHRLVIAKVASLKEGTAEDLRNLKRRGKGIMAYTDTMPKRISLRKDRKG